ncbi:MAG: hypothetical protein R3F65_05755 [bacterium]
MPRPLPFLLCALALVGCDGFSPERLLAEESRVALKEGLRAAEAAGRLRPLEDEAVADGPALARVLRRPLASALGALGPMTLTLTARFAVEADGAVAVGVDETRTLRIGPGGAWAFEQRGAGQSEDLPAREDGRRCAVVGGDFYTAGLHGPSTRVEPIADEHHRCLEGLTEPLATLARLYADGLRVEVVGVDRVLGRDVLVVRVEHLASPGVATALPSTYGADGLDEHNSPAIFGPRPPLAVAYTHVERLGGTLALDRETGQPLAAKLGGRFSLRKHGRAGVLVVELTLEAAPLDGEIAAPAEARIYGPRQRIFDEQRRLLGARTAAAVALPGPGDAPPLRLGPDGELTTEAPPADEDRPPTPAPAAPAPAAPQDEDRPE